MKKVLFIAYLYPPIFNSGTRRSLEFVNHLPDHGWEPTVLTLQDPEPGSCDPSLLDEVRPGTRVERAPYSGVSVARRLAPLLSRLVPPQRLVDAIAWRTKRFWNVPDECASWAPAAVARGIALHRATPFDAIYATGWPWTAFLVAEKISRATGVPFIVDYRDLWKPAEVAWDQATWLQRRINPLLEARVLRRAAGVIATTGAFLRLLPQDRLPRHQFAITNGFDEKDFGGAAAASAADGVRIVYTGVWRPGYGPVDLYEAVKLLKAQGSPCLARLKIVMAGFAPGRARDYGIEDHVEELGRVPHAEAIALMRGADALYLPVSKGVYEVASIPGKLFEYLGSRRPVLVSAQAGSEVAQVIAHTGGAVRLEPDDSVALAHAIEQLCLSGPGAIFAPRDEAALQDYTRGRLTGKLALALDTVAARQP
ncbi:MAG: glycosyltransferase [Pseudomonadota bacterium]